MVFRATAAEQRLEQAGMEPKVARAVTETLEDMHGALANTLVTKEYLDAKLATLETKISALEKWVIGIGGATLIAVLAALLRDVLIR